MRVKGIIQGLQQVATFLNAAGPRTTHTQWPALFRRLCAQMNLGGFQVTFAQANILRRQIHHHLAFLRWIDIEPDRVNDPISWTDDERAFFRAGAPLERPFDDLVHQLNRLQLKTTWQYQPLAPQAKPRDPSQAILKVRWNDGTTGRWTAQAWPLTKTPTDHLYAILGKALETGALNRLKVCRECEKYIVVADLKTRFCSLKCHDKYHNRVTHAENRKHRRGAAIVKANRLMGAGKSTDEIMDETGLPRRVVEQILSGDLSPNSQQRPKTVPRPKRRTAGLDPTFVPVPLTREQLETIIAEEAHRDEVYMQRIRAARKPSKQKPARKTK